MGFSWPEYWSGLPFPPPGDFPDPGIKPASLASPALAGGFFLLEPPGRPPGQKQIWPSFIHREMQIKSTVRYHLISTRMIMIMIIVYAATAAKSLGFSRQEHWSGLPFPSPSHESEKWKWSHSVVSRLFATPWTAACQAPPSVGFSRQEYWSRCHCLTLHVL